MLTRMMIRIITTESLIWRLSVTDVWESGETTQGFLPHRCCSRPKEGHDDHHYPNPPHLSNSNEGFYNLLMTFPWPPHLGGSWFLIMQLFLKGKQASTQMDICLLPNHIFKKFFRLNSSLYTFVFYSRLEVSHNEAQAREETTAILVNFRISHQLLPTFLSPHVWQHFKHVVQYEGFCRSKKLKSFLVFGRGMSRCTKVIVAGKHFWKLFLKSQTKQHFWNILRG